MRTRLLVGSVVPGATGQDYRLIPSLRGAAMVSWGRLGSARLREGAGLEAVQLAKLPVPVPRYRSIASFQRGSPRRRGRHLSPIALLAVALGVAVINPGGAHAATRTWSGLGVTNNWSEALNWSGLLVPAAGDIVVFDATSTKPSTIDVTTSVLGIAINAGYTGTVTQAGGSALTVGASGFAQGDGAFAGGSSAITVNGGFTLSNGTFTSTTGTLRVTAAFTRTGGTFTPNGGTVSFSTSAATIDLGGALSFNHVTFLSGNKTIAAGTTLIVDGNLTLTAGSMNLGTLSARGAISQASTYAGGTATLQIDGTADQTFTGAATPTAGALPNLVIAKPSGTLTLAGTLRTGRNWTVTSGSVDPGTSLVVLVGTQLISGSVIPFHDLTVNGGGASLTTSGQIMVDGTLALVQGVLNAGSGTVSIGPTGTVVRTAGHVAGALRKPVPMGTGVVITFEVGDTAAYTPISLTFGSISTQGSMVASSIPGDHPDAAASVINPAASVNRHWVLRNEAAAFDTLDLTLTFVVGDVDPGARTDRFVVGKRDATWSAPTVGAALPTSITAMAITSLSEFAVGEQAANDPAPVPSPSSLPAPTPVPATSRLPNTVGEHGSGSGGGSPVLLWLLLGGTTALGVVNVAARRRRHR